MIVWEPSYEGLHEPHGQKILKHIIISSSSYTYLTSSASFFVPTASTRTRSTWIANIVYAVIMLLVATTRMPAVSAAGLPSSSSSLHQVVDKSETHLLAKSIEIQCPVSNSCPCHKYEDGKLSILTMGFILFFFLFFFFRSSSTTSHHQLHLAKRFVCCGVFI